LESIKGDKSLQKLVAQFGVAANGNSSRIKEKAMNVPEWRGAIK